MTGTVPAGTTGTLVNTATVTPPLGVTDPVPGNNSSEATTVASLVPAIPALDTIALALLAMMLGLAAAMTLARRGM